MEEIQKTAEELVHQLLDYQHKADPIQRILIGDLIEQACAIRRRLSQIDHALKTGDGE